MNRIIEDLNNLSHDQYKVLKKTKIMIGTPMYGGTVMGNYLLSMSATLRWGGLLNLSIWPEFIFGATYPELGRNIIANKFMQSNATHLIFLDADQGWTANNFFELVLQDKGIVGGLYPRRRINWEAVRKAALAGVPAKHLEMCSGDFPMHPLKETDIEIGYEPQKVLTLPTGFMCIKREVFEIYAKAHPERATTPGAPGHFGMEYFVAECRTYEGLRGFDSEDNLFCKDMLELGVNTWLCPWMNVNHFGAEMHESCMPCSMGYYDHHHLLEKPLELVK